MPHGFVRPTPASPRSLDFKPPAFAPSVALGYGARGFELYALRTSIVAFCPCNVTHGAGSPLLQPTTVSVLATILALPSSILGAGIASASAEVSARCLVGIIGPLIGLAGDARPPFGSRSFAATPSLRSARSDAPISGMTLTGRDDGAALPFRRRPISSG